METDLSMCLTVDCGAGVRQSCSVQVCNFTMYKFVIARAGGIGPGV